MVDSSSPDHGVALRGLPAAAKAVVAQFLSTSDVPAGALLVREGDRSRELYFVAEGEVRLLRAGAEIARLGPGDPIGDLPFVAGLPSPTTAVAATRLRLAHLSFERFRVLSATHPEVGAALHDLLVTRLSFAGARASREPPPLVHERSLPRRAEVSVRIQGVVRQVPVGIAVRHLLPERLKGHLVAAAILDHKAVSLMTPVTAACEVAPLSTDHWEGQRVHRRSLGLAVLEALRRVAPDVQARIGPSLGFAQRVLLLGVPKADIDGLAGRLKGAISELVAEAASLREEWWSVNEALEHFTAERSDAAALLQTWRDPSVPLVSYGQVYAIELGPLLPHTGLLQGFHVLADEDALVLVYGAESSARPLASRLFPAVPESWGAASGVAPAALAMPPEGDAEAAYLARHARRASAYASAVTVQQERWLAALEVTSVGAFNQACVSGDVSQIVRVSEGFHEKRIGAIADEIRDRLPDVRVVCIAGPSSSGKSTFIRRLEVQLQVNGIRPVGLSLDDYYVDRHLTPKDAEGALDYEAFEALRIDLLGDQVARLLDGLTVTTARYDFTTGVSQPEGGRSLALGDRAVLLLEGIHGLNPRLLSNLPAERVLRIFCSPLAQLPFDSLTRVHASDVRLIRRVVRDRHSRSTDAAGTIARWPSVRAGERSHIFPFQHHADAVFDSSLVYEMGVLRVFAERYLLEVPRAHPSYATAFRLIRLLDRFVAIYPDHVPRTSILREFVGGPGL